MNKYFNKNETQSLLRYLGIKYDPENANEEGWLTISSPFRRDKNPSFSLNIYTGHFIDNATNWSGNIYDLIKKEFSCDFQEAKRLAYKHLGYSTSSISQESPEFESPTVSDGRDTESADADPLTDDQKERIQKARLELDNFNQFGFIKSYDLLNKNVLQRYGCGWEEHGGKQWLLMPYRTGCQMYRRENGDKVIRNFNGSKPGQCFFGEQQINGRKTLMIAKSPREVMLLYQEYQDHADAIGLPSGEHSHLSEGQRDFLQQQKEHLDEIQIYMDCDTENARQTAEHFAQFVKQTVGDSCEVILCNVFESTNGRAKDVRDAIAAGLDDFASSTQTFRVLEPFWTFNQNGNPKILHHELIEFWERNGFMRYLISAESDPIYIWKEDNNVLKQVPNRRVLSFTRKYIDSLPEKFSDPNTGNTISRSMLAEKTLHTARSLVSDKNLGWMPPETELNLIEDTADASFFFFNNGIVKVTENDLQLLGYKEVDGSVWNSQIIDHNISLDAFDPNFCFHQFMENICSKPDSDGNYEVNPERLLALKTAMGYLLHRYKNASNAKAVILIDEVIGDEGYEGRTGKSLFLRSIKEGEERNVAYISGRNWDPDHRFAFQTVNIDHDLIFIDDIKDRFKFPALFNHITDDMMVEKKGQSSIIIPFEDSPKICLTSNVPILTSGASTRGRQNIHETSDYYNESFKPQFEFGHTFFSDWSTTQWNMFYLLKFHCLQMYLKQGLKSYKVNYEENQLIESTSREFVTFCDDYFQTGKDYDKRSVYGALTMNNPSFPYQQPKMTRWIRKWADHRGYIVKEWPSNGVQYLRLEEKDDS